MLIDRTTHTRDVRNGVTVRWRRDNLLSTAAACRLNSPPPRRVRESEQHLWSATVVSVPYSSCVTHSKSLAKLRINHSLLYPVKYSVTMDRRTNRGLIPSWIKLNLSLYWGVEISSTFLTLEICEVWSDLCPAAFSRENILGWGKRFCSL